LTASILLVHSFIPSLAEGRPQGVEEVIRRALEAWPPAQHGAVSVSYWALYARAEAALYRGEGRRARELIAREWPSLVRETFIAHVEVHFLLIIHLRARTALAAAEATPPGVWLFGPRARLLRSAARDARRIERRRMPWAQPLAGLIHAGIAALRGRREEARALLAAAEEGFIAADMMMYAAAARRRRGQLLGGEDGRGLVRAGDAWMTGQDICNPALIAAMLAPGFDAPHLAGDRAFGS
jgi:hypothetical protein